MMLINTQLFNLLVPPNVPFCRRKREKGQSSGIRHDIQLSAASLPQRPLLHWIHRVRKTDVQSYDTKVELIYDKIVDHIDQLYCKKSYRE